ncbi:MAG: phosphoribosylformylglycinamidine cyclo-ligase, partial [Actinomycetota bacterium]
AVGRLNEERDTVIVSSVARACAEAGCALVGGETAEHPGVMADDAVDLAGAAVGVVEEGEELGPRRVEAGDLVVGLRSPNLRSNGFSLVREVFADGDLSDLFPEEGTSVGEVLMRPSVVYSPTVLAAAATGGVRSAAHITGGGLTENLERSVPAGLQAVVDHWSWEWPNVFTQVQRRGGISVEEMRSTFNLGIGFCLIVDPDHLDPVLEAVSVHDPTTIGRIQPA